MKFENYLLKLEKEINKKNKEDICLHGISSIIKQIYLELKAKKNKQIIKILNKELNVPYQTFYSWISGQNPAPILKIYNLLKLWKKSFDKSKKEFDEKWDDIYQNTTGYSQNGQRTIILPKELNKNLGYITGFFQGDGHLKKENKKGFQEYSLYFYERDKNVLDKINNTILEEFGIIGKIYFRTNSKGHKWHVLRISSKPIYNFLKNVLSLRAGKTVRTTEVPEIIKKAEKNIQLNFIRGFFDAEGTVGENKKNPWLEVGQASKDNPCEILLWIKNKLDKENILLSEPKRTKNQEFFRLRTAKRENIKRFFEIISSNHQDKINKFKAIIEKCQKN